jgi:hypothetical protein
MGGSARGDPASHVGRHGIGAEGCEFVKHAEVNPRGMSEALKGADDA